MKVIFTNNRTYMKSKFCRNFICVAVMILTILVTVACEKDENIVVKNKNSEGNNMENIINYGYLAMQDEYQYFYQETGSQGLYRSKTDGSGKVKLDSGFIHDINVVGDKIYYIIEKYIGKTSEEIKDLYEFSLYSIDINGKNKSLVEKNCGMVIAQSDYLYYVYEVDSIAYMYDDKKLPDNDRYLYRYNIKTENKELLINEKVGLYKIYGDSIYFTKFGSGKEEIYKLNINNSNGQYEVFYKGTDNKEIGWFALENNNTVSVFGGGEIFFVDTETKKKTVQYVDDNDNIPDDQFIIFPDCIYYISSKGSLYKLAFADETPKEIVEYKNSSKHDTALYKFKDKCYYWKSDGTIDVVNQ